MQCTRTPFSLLVLLCAVSLGCATATGQSRPAHDNHVVLFGNLHAHSRLSDDVSTRTTKACCGVATFATRERTHD